MVLKHSHIKEILSNLYFICLNSATVGILNFTFTLSSFGNATVNPHTNIPSRVVLYSMDDFAISYFTVYIPLSVTNMSKTHCLI